MNELISNTEDIQRMPPFVRVLLPLLAIGGLILVGSYGLAALLLLGLISVGR